MAMESNQDFDLRIQDIENRAKELRAVAVAEFFSHARARVAGLFSGQKHPVKTTV